MKSVALIACSNGLGHTRRVVLLANALVNKQLKVTVFAPFNYISMLNQLDSFKGIKLVDFNTQTSASSFSTSNSQNWYKLLPDLSVFGMKV